MMRAVEDAVIEIERALDPAAQAPRRVMTEYQNDLPDSARCAMRAKLGEIRAEIQDAKDCYDLYADTVSNRRRLSTKLSILAIDLTDCRPAYMRGYGEVPDEERQPLDERMSRLEAMVNALNRMLTSHE
ncbi:MAG: hypothetical protein IVW56_00760 [Candidatus Binataceae bacterium]|nr:hypothetical protein [Candidatus Binataceae bacterium]